MCDEFITAKHIEKLSHHIPEIRERALLNIYSKLQRGIYYDNDLARCKELFWQLCNWFRENEPPIRHDEIVTKMLKRIIKSETGIHLIDLHSINELLKEFNELKNIVNEASQCHLDEIIEYLQNSECLERRPNVPPLNLDELDSFRSSYDNADCSSYKKVDIGTTATTIAGFVDSFVSLDVADNNNIHKDSAKTNRTTKITSSQGKTSENPFYYYTFLWQWLIGADRHVLESVENTLRDPSEPTELLNSLEFITDVLLNDFPAEVFLQRPAIVKQLHDILWSSPSSRITTAILKCLGKLTKEFIKRIRYYDSPGTHNLKLNNFHFEATPHNTNREENDDSSSTDVETIAETSNLMKQQMNLPQFCLNTINAVFDYVYVCPEAGESFRRKKCQTGINTALILLRDAINLLKSCVKSAIFTVQHKSHNVEVTLKKVEETLQKYGEVLAHFRIKVLSEDFQDETRLIQLHLLKNFQYLHAGFLPTDKNLNASVLPANLRHVLAETMLDAPLGRLFPSLHRHLHALVEDFHSDETFEDVTRVCGAMTASIRFLRERKALPFAKNVCLMEEALASLEFHQNLHVVAAFVDLIANKLTTHTFDEEIVEIVERVMLRLLSHADGNVKLAAYANCHAKVVKTVGAKCNASKSSAPGSQILFLLRGRILSLIATHGLNDPSEEVQGLCEDILVHVLKAKLLVSEEIWQETVAALMPTMPVLLTHASDKNSLIGRHVLTLLDPDRCRMMNFAAVEVVRLNIGLLFVKSSEVRLEAASRLCWLLSSAQLLTPSSGGSAREARMLPHLNNLHDRVLADVCQSERRVDFRSYRGSQTHFYQPSSLHQVLDLLASENVEPVIRRSAITQVSVMMEDPLLHSLFLERDGLEIIKRSMRSALADEDYRDYPDSAIPCLGILKCLCLYSATVRQQIANSEELLHLILRGVFMFCAEPRVKQDGGVLLHFVVFNEYIRGSPLKNDLAVADVLRESLSTPYEAKSYSTAGEHALKSLKNLTENKWALSSLQIHWNIEYFQGLDVLLQPKLSYNLKDKTEKFSDVLKLSPVDLRAVKSTSLEFTIDKCLGTVLQSHCHEIILENLHILSRCINLYEIAKEGMTFNLDAFDWEKSLSRYLNAPPAGQQDNHLLSLILDLFAYLFPHLNLRGNNAAWIVSLLTSKTHYFNTLLAMELAQDQDPDVERLLNSLLNLVNVSVIAEQSRVHRHFAAGKETPAEVPNKYAHVVRVLVDNLQCGNTKHFYNLAYLDRLLASLTHLTATLGWSEAKHGEALKKVMIKLATCAFELLNAFHCGKGPTAADSLMGLSITRNVVLVLNHLVAEMQHFGVRNWEECFEDADEAGSAYGSVFALRNSRDVVLRAAAIHLLSGFAMSTRCTLDMIRDIAEKKDYLYLWKMTLGILCDHDESAIVREHAALLLTNLSSHVEQNGGEVVLTRGILVKTKAQHPAEYSQDTQKKVLVTLLDSCNFFNEVEIILKRLRTDRLFNFYEVRAATDSDLDDFMFVYNKVLEVSTFSDSLNPNPPTKSSQKFEETFGITTPGVIKALAGFVFNLVCILPQTVSRGLQTMGLIKLFFKCVTLPNVELQSARDLLFYADVLQMNTAICVLLAKTARVNENCLLTIGNARDCLSTLTALFDPEIFVVSLPELHYLRNKLWTSVFNLIGVLLREDLHDTDESEAKNMKKFDTSLLIMQLECRREQFLLSLCESISTDVSISNDLQTSALSALLSLLKCNQNTARLYKKDENANENDAELSQRSSVQLILDETRTPRAHSPKNPANCQRSSKFDLLKEVYFGSGAKTSKSSLSVSSLTSEEENIQDRKENRMAGAELCRILLQLQESLNLQQSTKTFASVKKPGKISRKAIVLGTLTCLLLVSSEAKNYALEHGLAKKIMSQLQTICVQLSLENVDSLRKASERRRILPILQELESLLGLMMNFVFGGERVKAEAARLGLTDLLHKLWHWFGAQKGLSVTALKLLCTLTTKCATSAASLSMTSCTPGAGPRKAPSNSSLLHVICATISREMELISRTHGLETLQLCFHVLHNAATVSECRFVIVKGNFLAGVGKLHPALTKRQKPWEQVELMWLQFLADFSGFAEGQAVIGKTQEVFEIVLSLCGCPNARNRQEALKVLRNIAFYQGNRARLLASDDFLGILSSRLGASLHEEVKIIVPTIWTLAAHCQKAKMIFKAAQLDGKLKNYLRVLYLNNYAGVTDQDVKTMRYVLSLLTQNS